VPKAWACCEWRIFYGRRLPDVASRVTWIREQLEFGDHDQALAAAADLEEDLA
jgi:hypothetical protein